jgi:hypothetical protein
MDNSSKFLHQNSTSRGRDKGRGKYFWTHMETNVAPFAGNAMSGAAPNTDAGPSHQRDW